MALFKILSNMVVDENSPKTPPDPYGCIKGVEDDGLAKVREKATSLPSSFNQGYCYFDRSTGKFWIDTTVTPKDGVELNENKNDRNSIYVQGRIPINAYYADLALLATSAEYDGIGTEEENKITSYVHGTDVDGNRVLTLLNGQGQPISSPAIDLGTIVTICEWSTK